MRKAIITILLTTLVVSTLTFGIMNSQKEKIEQNAIEQYEIDNQVEQNMVLELISDLGYHFQDEGYPDMGFFVPMHEKEIYGIGDLEEFQMVKVVTSFGNLVSIKSE